MMFGSIITSAIAELIQETQSVSNAQLLHEYGFCSPIDFRNCRQFLVHLDLLS